MNNHPWILAIAALGLTACTQTTGPDRVSESTTPQPSPGRTCDVSLVDKIGDPITSVRVPAGNNYRVIRQNDVLTTDFLETRTNIGLNTDETIKSVYCG